MIILEDGSALIATALDNLTVSTSEMQHISVLLVDAEKRLAEHEFKMGTPEDTGHIKLGAGFERGENGVTNFMGKTHFDNVVAEHNAAPDAHTDIRAELAEAKEPKPHAASHSQEGTDPLGLEALGVVISGADPTGTAARLWIKYF